jgi:adenylate cyclase
VVEDTDVAELIATGPEPAQRWRRTLVEGTPVQLGRAPTSGWAVPWDSRVSREHVELVWEAGQLRVRCLEAARNPVFVRGQAASDFTLGLGEHFVIGATSFRVVEDQASVSLSAPSPLEEHSFRPGDLRRIQFREADHRLEVLSHLPELIAQSSTEEMFSTRLVGLLLAGIARAEAVALVERLQTQPTDAGGPAQVRVLQWDRRRDASGPFRPSQRLILEALSRGDTVLHVWGEAAVADPQFTVSENLDWAICTPVSGEACRGWGLYVAGSFRAPGAGVASTTKADLEGDMRFAELVAELMGALWQVRLLERQRAVLRQFFSPAVLDALAADDSADELEPKETAVTVLFCDLRGFAKEAEHWRGDLQGLLQRVSEALGVMTHQILAHGGVIGDFQGDAAMGFWGWPLRSTSGPLDACLAALAIRTEFQRAAHQPGHPLADFHVGIGIAYGRAVAGKIGTADQVKVTVFGPVVNLASRLEGMTKQLRVPILLDEPTAEHVRRHLPASRGRCRRLARVLPYGMETPLTVSELLPPADQAAVLSDSNLSDYESAVDSLLAGRWSEALDLLHRVPAKDRAKDFLTIFIAQHNYQPPPHWNGVIPMASK